MNKQELWKELCNLEKIAAEKAAAKTSIHIVNIIPGHESLAVLNSHLGKKLSTKLKHYSPEDVEKAFSTIKSSEFIKDLTNHFVKESGSPESQLAVLRAQRLIDPSVEIPQELVNLAKKNQSDRLQRLWNELESLGAEVCELVEEEDGYVGFKIITPIGGYLDYARPKDIIQLVKRDMRLYKKKNRCPGCGSAIDYAKRDIWGIMSCQNCGTLIGSIPQNLAKHAVDVIFSQYGQKGIHTMLKNWSELYHFDSEIGCSFIFAGKVGSLITGEISLPEIEGPDLTNPRVDIKVPLLLTWEEDEEYQEKFPATCRQCLFCSVVNDSSDVILGVEHSYSHMREFPVCLFPVRNTDLESSIGFELQLEPEEMRGYRKNEEGIIWNAFLNRFLEQFVRVDSQQRNLEAMLPDQTFFGPICPRFVFDENCIDLEDNGGPYRVLPDSVTVSFGYTNFAALAAEKAKAEKEKKERELLESIDSKITNSELWPKLKRRRFEMDSCKLLAEFLSQTLTKEEISCFLKFPLLRKYFNVSNKVCYEAPKQALELCENER